MGAIDSFIYLYLVFFFIHSVFYLLYQFDVLKIRDKTMIKWIRVTDLCETILLVVTHIFGFSVEGSYGLGAFYILNFLLLMLQFIFDDWDPGRKILDFFWMGFYVILFLIDVCGISMTEIVCFISKTESIRAIEFLFEETIIGNLLIGVITPVLRTIILEAIHRNE